MAPTQEHLERSLAACQEPDLHAREARLAEREDAIAEREKALRDLEEAITRMKIDLAAQPSAREVARTPKKRQRRRGQRVVFTVSVSPRKRSPARSKKCRISLSTASSCSSPPRRNRRSRQSGASLMSMEEPPPTLTNECVADCEPVDGLLGNFPLPLGISSWDWPLSRDEQKALVLMFDRQELMVQRDEFADLAQRRKLEGK
mmetsp:Transcript_49900/g.78965  ORF Transcript_49900/g.78965 Transcript_49900/m.78965 type:complete len:203 (+) Transcript_49900:56-664(+)|eukprot:CAMPEP_0169082840 /NCGR_PEP_ID=MMETSP1015-20121227/11757_1 /TAXON_ID=342587 /ORGANISM="Karlodinium micrum, Strain CCMP2283" /LENGTH=202 /DNA_ID=CAMNT_0009142719 /DNA_START=54 /DNA_END=665 /DNA_ORIENTATION=-